MKKIQQQLKNEDGFSPIGTLGLFLIIILLFSFSFSYIKIKIQLNEIKTELSRAITTTATENVDNIYSSLTLATTESNTTTRFDKNEYKRNLVHGLGLTAVSDNHYIKEVNEKTEYELKNITVTQDNKGTYKIKADITLYFRKLGFAYPLKKQLTLTATLQKHD